MNDSAKMTAAGPIPFFTPSSIRLLAMGACPWPRDSALKHLLIPEASASCSRAPVGSTPGDSTKIRGVQLVDSSTTWENAQRVRMRGRQLAQHLNHPNVSRKKTPKSSNFWTFKTIFCNSWRSRIKCLPDETYGLHVEDRWLHKTWAQIVNDEGGDAERHAVLA